MKSERRHQLQHNELADQIEKARHWLEPYLIPGLLAVISLSLLFAGYSFFSTRATNERSDATLELLFGTRIEPGVGEDAEAYERIAKDFPDQPSAQIASLLMADQLLQKGIDALYRDREEAKGLLADAEAGYRKVLEMTKENLLKTRAQCGLAMALESQGEISKAEEAYKTLLELNESKEMGQWVEQRLASLQQPQTKQFMEWFSQQKPTAFTPSTPPGLPSGDLLPDSPDILAPSVQPAESTPAAPTLGEQIDQLGGGKSGEPMKENPSVEAPPTTDAPPAETPTSGASAEVPPAQEAPAEAPKSEEAPAPPAEAPSVEEPAPANPTEPAPESPSEPAPSPSEETPAPNGDTPAVEPSGDAPSGSSGGSF